MKAIQISIFVLLVIVFHSSANPTVDKEWCQVKYPYDWNINHFIEGAIMERKLKDVHYDIRSLKHGISSDGFPQYIAELSSPELPGVRFILTTTNHDSFSLMDT